MYDPFKERLQKIISEQRGKNILIKGATSFGTSIGSIDPIGRNLIKDQRSFSSAMKFPSKPMSSAVASPQLQDAKLGVHPDFARLKGTDEIAYHYIVSAFIDIQGSTNLHRKYDLVDIFRITNTIQSAAIHTIITMGGHVQRLLGDGVFAYFGGKSIDKKKANELAVTACSMFTYFVENDLKSLFLTSGIEDINTRIGIDFGDDDDVLWANFGLLDVSELTTNSLHTSLASKMQQWATRNGIVVGLYVKEKLSIADTFFDLVRNSKGEVEKRYIFEIPDENFRYTQYKFDWLKYLKSLPFIQVKPDGTLTVLDSAEQERIERLRNSVKAASVGNSFLSPSGQITANPSGVRHEPHRFHHGK